MMKIKLKKSNIVLLAIALFSILFNLVIWLSTPFCDWYVKNIFPLSVNLYSRVMSVFPFSFGEILIALGVLLITVGVLVFLALLIFVKKHRRKIAIFTGKFYAWVLVIVFFVQSVNCFVLYHCSPFAEKYSMNTSHHGKDELIDLTESIIEKANETAQKLKRDENGKIILTSNLETESIRIMKNLGKTYDGLDGYYPTPKPIMASYFMSQQFMMGIYFPFTMEANYNNDMLKINLPSTVCHELAHIKGFIQEDEANFISYLACVESENPEFEYSAYLTALDYLLPDVKEVAGSEAYDKVVEKMSELLKDDRYREQKYWTDVYYNPDNFISSEVISGASDKFFESSLIINGVEDGFESYGRMVGLLLDYYYSN